jgi:hypothetical protein
VLTRPCSQVCLPDCGKLRPLHVARAIFQPMARLSFVCNARVLALRSLSRPRRNSTDQIQQQPWLDRQRLVSALLSYGIARFEGRGQVGAYQPNPVPRQIVCAVKIAQFPATAVPSRLSLHPRAPRISPGERPRGIRVYIGWRNPDVFATLGWFGLGSPIVPVVQPSQSHRRKDAT